MRLAVYATARDMDFILDPVEARVLGALLEKEITTPEYYPMSLNALVNACNQKSNRDPVVAYDDDTVEDAVARLKPKGLMLTITGAGSRVAKYAHRLSEKLNLGRRETAILCELMVRGPQTIGELRNRADRMHSFADLPEVESVLEHMTELVTKLPRRPGEKEQRYAHLLSGEPQSVQTFETAGHADIGGPEAHPRADRITALEAETARLRDELEDLRRQFADFRRQFE
jgi:uncharacterized protein YceH (UPF0502 family)